MEYNWKCAKISSSRVFKVWEKELCAFHKIQFLDKLKINLNKELLEFAVWCVEKYVEVYDIESDNNSALATAKRVIAGESTFNELRATAGRYNGQHYQNLQRELHIRNIYIDKNDFNISLTWATIMLQLCQASGYECAYSVMSQVEKYIIEKTRLLNKKIVGMDTERWEIEFQLRDRFENIYSQELARRFKYLFDEKYIEIFVDPSALSMLLNIGPFHNNDPERKNLSMWTFGSWNFCVENGIIK